MQNALKFKNLGASGAHPTQREMIFAARYQRGRFCKNIRGEAMAKASWCGKVIAESNATVEVEGNQYFPADAVKKEFLKPSAHTSECPWKGTAHYYSVEVGGMRNDNAAWYYPQPKPAAAEIKDHIAFWKGVRVEG
jgi:uncharacterized protein (DUF427 family)